MMDESRVVPKGSHFGCPWSHDGSGYNLTWRHRCSVSPVDYYYIDFGLSSWYPGGKETATSIGAVGQVKSVPELSDTVPYNPFQVDIYQLGYTILEVAEVGILTSLQQCIPTHKIMQDYRGLQMFVPLGRHMTCPNPADRPTVSAALAEFEAIVSSIKQRKMNTRIWRKKDTLIMRFICHVCDIPIL